MPMAGERGTEELRAMVPPCCTVGVLGVESPPEAEQQVVDRILPGSKSLVVLAHHVTAVTEWVWFPLGREKTRMTCAADLHCQVVLGRLREHIARLGEKSELVQYPALSGLSFKLIAAAAGLGEIGLNGLLVHPQWGPRVHLRLLVTGARFAGTGRGSQNTCTKCGRCIEACPGKAISPSGFDRAACAAYQRSRFRSTLRPARKCEKCVRACPIGARR